MAVEAAQADGRWEKAYDSPKNMEVPEDFIAELSKDEKALALFGTLVSITYSNLIISD